MRNREERSGALEKQNKSAVAGSVWESRRLLFLQRQGTEKETRKRAFEDVVLKRRSLVWQLFQGKARNAR